MNTTTGVEFTIRLTILYFVLFFYRDGADKENREGKGNTKWQTVMAQLYSTDV